MDRREPFWSEEYRFRLADGSYADIFDRGFVIYDSDGAPIRMIGAMADISERQTRAGDSRAAGGGRAPPKCRQKNQELEHEVGRRQQVMELLRARNEELKAFAYTVSHDLKAPLRGIAGYAQELERRHSAGLGERGAVLPAPDSDRHAQPRSPDRGPAALLPPGRGDADPDRA